MSIIQLKHLERFYPLMPSRARAEWIHLFFRRAVNADKRLSDVTTKHWRELNRS